jgi:ADP-heptose:LPS heptosyltransferase
MRALIIRFSSLGDVVLVSTVLEPLRSAGAKVELLTYRSYSHVYKGDRRVRVVGIDKKELKNPAFFKKLVQNLESYDCIFDLHANLKSRLLTFTSRVPVYRYKKMALLRRLMVVFKPFKAKWLRVPELYAEPLRKAGIRCENPRPFIPVSPSEKEEVSRFVPSAPVAVVAPGARWQGKIYPINHFAGIVNLLHQRGFSTVVVGSKDDIHLGNYLHTYCGSVNLCGRLTLREVLAVIALSAVVISNDSAVVHMARAVKTPVVVIFGPTHPAFGFAPYPDEGVAITKNLPCSPCSLHGRTSCRHRRCLEIPPEEVGKVALSIAKGC